MWTLAGASAVAVRKEQSEMSNANHRLDSSLRARLPSKRSERGMPMGPANMGVQGYLGLWGTALNGFGREANDGAKSPRCVKPKGVWMASEPSNALNRQEANGAKDADCFVAS